MPADIDLRAEVLAGIDLVIRRTETADLKYALECRVGRDALTALRHLREIAERHTGEMVCGECQTDLPCPTLLSLAPDYAPQALAQMEADR